ncbi:MAG: tRNA (5-methylaminomethyl-2-thiouridine)(34)-methyltransferase MnmD [Leptonema sp. (in: bacteria)]
MYSERFQDIYFQKNGIDESRYVFLEGNQLEKKFQNSKNFSICELGFGTGLNFLLTAKLFLETNTKGTLYYYSIEKYPLSIYEIRKSLFQFKEIHSYLEQLLSILKSIYYPSVGFQTFYFHLRIRLTLIFGDVLEMLNQIHFSYFDAWFLDGFSPDKNPQMWRKEIYLEMARLSKKYTSFATFSVAKVVKEGLKEANFYIEKKEGFGNKREMLTGYYLGSNEPLPSSIKKVGIIGGGIAGVATAIPLLRQGYEVHLFEKNSSLLTEASAISAPLVMPYFGSSKSFITDLTLKSYNFLVSILYYIGYFQNTSLRNWIRIKKFKKFEKLELAKKIYQINSQSIRKFQDFYLAKGLVIDQKILLRLLESILFSYQNFYFYPFTEIIEILEEENQIYTLDNRSKDDSFDAIVFCNSHNVKKFFDYLDLQNIRGQLIEVDQKYIQNVPKNVIAEIFILNLEKKVFLGSSFEGYKNHLHRDPQSDAYILKKLKNHCPLIFHQIANEDFEFFIPTNAFVGFRSQSKDYLPNIGYAPDTHRYLDYLKNLYPNKKYHYMDIPIYNQERIFLNTSLGSRGYTIAFFGGEIIASLIGKFPIPVERELFYQLQPHRFIFRKWRSSGNRKKFEI